MNVRKLIIGVIFTTALVGCLTNREADMSKDNLRFNPNNYREGSIIVNGKSINYRAYEGIGYTANPVVTNYRAWQEMNIYVPLTADQSTPIFFKTEVGGYMPADPARIETPSMDGGISAIQRALAEGFVVVSPGSRGRTSQEFYIPGDNPFGPPKEGSGAYIGKAPAAIIDLKAAVRYLRYNDTVMPGDAEKIICDGTSAGGALSALLGASGNNPLYKPYLDAIGAAETRDDIFAAICFCPITDLEHADMAYEWLYGLVNDIRKKAPPGPGGPSDQSALPLLTEDEKALSAELASLFPAYLGSLGLKKSDGTALTADTASTVNGAYVTYIKEFVIASAQKAFNAASDREAFKSAFPWLIFARDGALITDIDLPVYLGYVISKRPLKSVPSFDSLGVNGAPPSGENELFGTGVIGMNNFTPFGWGKNAANQGGFPSEIWDRVYLMNAMNFIGAANTDTAKNWYIRHGTVDRDTSFTVSINLYTKLLNNGFNPDYELAWERPHSGDYDLDEVFEFIRRVM
jgi:hypothetical protein